MQEKWSVRVAAENHLPRIWPGVVYFPLFLFLSAGIAVVGAVNLDGCTKIITGGEQSRLIAESSKYSLIAAILYLVMYLFFWGGTYIGRCAPEWRKLIWPLLFFLSWRLSSYCFDLSMSYLCGSDDPASIEHHLFLSDVRVNLLLFFMTLGGWISFFVLSSRSFTMSLKGLEAPISHRGL
ncbi:hypothetical protein [Aestuariispira insulae]|uniref:Uncharacterized protein n=1 Tax=Aestuariispira insulae TaxID=1461337 RepID=A0A3D9HGS1_9PROT|nr:hypothetical protein [Aestuariispira insulae]RED48654.1 hypothetical protein DFP90_107159 [Aestuariispira insulae]